jgi:large subunit ribosomal protein L12
MEEVYAVLLLHKAGKEVNEENIKKVLKAASIDVSDAKIKAVVAALDGVNIDDAIKQASVAPAPASTKSEATETKKVKEKEEEKSEEGAAAGLAGLFG